MDKPCIVVVDMDDSYVAAIELKFLEEIGDIIQFEAITSPDYLVQYLSKPHDIEALLVAEDAYSDKMSKQNVKHLFILTESDSSSHTNNLTGYSSTDYIFKYDTAMLYNMIAATCKFKVFNKGMQRETKVLLFYSPVGGAGKSTLSVAIAACMKGMHYNVLYIDAESLQSLEPLIKDPKIMSQNVVNAMLMSDEDALNVVSKELSSNLFDYLPPLYMSFVAQGVVESWFFDFIEYQKKIADYDYIIVDTDNSFNEEKIKLMSLADNIILVITQSKTSIAKVTKFLKNIDNIALSKIHLICNMWDPEKHDTINLIVKKFGIIVDAPMPYSASIPDKTGEELAKYDIIKQYVFAYK